MESISEHVRREREAKGITIEELAKETFISVAVLKDIELGKFDKYQGDELYLKMYLRKIAKCLGLEEHELDAEFEALTQEIQMEKIRDDKQTDKENKKNVTISGKMSGTFKDLKNVKPKKPVSNKRVYEDRYLVRYFKYALVGLVCIAIIFVVWYSIVASKSSTANNDFDKKNPTTVEGSNDAGTQKTDDNNDSKKDDTNDTKKDEPVAPTVTITKNAEMDYSFKLDPSQTTFKFKMEFVGRTWSQLKINGTEYEGFKSGIYNDTNKSNALDAAPETVELELDAATVNTIDLKIGYFMGHRFYINDIPLELDASEYDGQNKTLKIAQVR